MASSPSEINYDSMSMSVLKIMLESHGCDTSGKKAVLVQRLSDKVVALERARRSTAVRTVVVSAASTSELDRASAEMRAI